MSFEIYELEPTRFLTARELPWQTTLKKTKKIRSFHLINDRKKMSEENAIHRYAKAKTKITNRDNFSIGI